MGRRKKKDEKNLGITVLVLILISIVLAVLIYTKSGYIGKNLSPALGGIFGYIKYFIPVFLFLGAVNTLREKDYLNYRKKIGMIIIIMVFIDIVLATSQISSGNIDRAVPLGDSLSKAFDLGTKDMGGGVLGTLFAVPLVKLFGSVATVIISVGLSLVLLVYVLGLHPVDIIQGYFERNERMKEEAEKNEQKIAAKETARERKEREKEEKRLAKLAEKEKKTAELDDQITINIKQPDSSKTAGVEVPDFNENDTKRSKLLDLFKKNREAEDVEEPEVKAKSQEAPVEDNFKEQEIEKEEKTKQVLELEHTALVAQEENYEFPPISLLGQVDVKTGNSRKKLLETAEKLRKTLSSFGVSAKVENVSVGPAITRYELSPAQGVRVSKIANLSDDIALSLEAESIRIEAPIPGKHTVGIEIPNKTKSTVPLRDIIESDKFVEAKSKVAFALGKDVAGDIVVTDIAKMPHLLIAGQTGSGKSVCINTLIASILYKAKPSEVKLLMIDPKVVELSVYNGIPHLLIPVVTDPKKASGALQWAVQEMVARYDKFAKAKVRDIKGYNEKAEENGENKLPQIVIIIDELADLMMVAAKDVQDSICRLAQLARAAGMNLVIATQRPSVDVITGIIKANIPSRIAFSVSSFVDSKTILDIGGAEKLLGKGDMLFYPTGESKPARIQGAFISDKEVENIVKFVKKDETQIYDEKIMEEIENSQKEQGKDGKGDPGSGDDDETDPLLNEAIEMVIDSGTASTSYIQRRFKVGYARAGRIIDQMEERGVISGYAGSKPREVLISKERWAELKMAPTSGKPLASSNVEDDSEDTIDISSI